MHKLNVLVAGSTGYIGIQLIKLLSSHTSVLIKYLCGNTSIGKKISYFDKSLETKKLPNIVKFNISFLKNIDSFENLETLVGKPLSSSLDS